MHRLRQRFPGPRISQLIFHAAGMEFLARRGSGWFPTLRPRHTDLAAGHLSVSSWRDLATFCFNLLYLAMFGADLEHDMGIAKVLPLLFSVRNRGGPDRRRGEVIGCWNPHGLGSASDSDDRRVRGDLRGAAGECSGAAGSPRMDVSAPGDGVHADFRDHHGRDRIFRHDWRHPATT